MVVVREYPWHALERLSRSTLRAARRVRAALARSSASELNAVLTELVGSDVEVLVRDYGRARLPAGAREIVVRVSEPEAYFAVAIEPDGAQALLGRVLGRPLGLPKQELELGAALWGATAALVVEAVRRVAGAPVELAVAPTTPPLELQATVLVDGRAYAATLRAWSSLLAPEPESDPRALPSLSVDVPLVVALALARRDELAALGIGDGWFPGEGWWIDRAGAGKCALAAPASERGVWADLTPEGTVVLRGGKAELVADAPAEVNTMSADDNQPEASLSDVVLETPVVVRVELGAVSLSAGEVLALKPGDVLETGKRLAEPALLRVAGRVIARGDLVEVEGELGVRIRELLGRDT